MRAANLRSESMGWELNMFFAKEARYSEVVFRFAQRNASFTMRTRNFLPEIRNRKFDMTTAGGAGHLEKILIQLRAAP